MTYGDGSHSHSYSATHSHDPLSPSAVAAASHFRRASSQQTLRRAASPIHPTEYGDGGDGPVSPDWDDTLFPSSAAVSVPKVSLMSAAGPTSNPFAPSAMQRAEVSLHRGSVVPAARLPKLGSR